MTKFGGHGCSNGKLHYLQQARFAQGLPPGSWAEPDVHKTVVITPFGLFEFVRMPFGLRNSAQTFQHLMDEVLHGIPHMFVYIDDLLVASKTAEELVVHLREMLQCLEEHRLVLNGEKCMLRVGQVEYLPRGVHHWRVSSSRESGSSWPLPQASQHKVSATLPGHAQLLPQIHPWDC